MGNPNLVKGNGTKWEIKPGVFQYRFNMGRDPITGKYRYSPKRTLHCEGKSKRTQQAMLRTAMEEYKQELNSGIIRSGKRTTVRDYAEAFHTIRGGEMGSPLAYDREGLDVRHIVELFGSARIDELKPSDIKGAYAKARKDGRFSDSELSRINIKLKQILECAVDDDIIRRNPCKGISMPKPQGRERQALSLEEAQRLSGVLRSSAPSPQIVCTLLMLDCGMRKGEALGLEWQHLNEGEGTLTIVQQYTSDKTLRPPKSRMSNRVISPSPGMLDYLKQWRSLQSEELSQRGLVQQPETPIVHSYAVNKDENGISHAEVIHMDNHNFSRWFRDFCVDNGFGTYGKVTKTFVRDGKTHVRGSQYKGLCPHMLRHTQATLLIGSGSDIKTVQARIGHASPGTTLAIYSHAIAANDKKAASTFGALMTSADEPRGARPGE